MKYLILFLSLLANVSVISQTHTRYGLARKMNSGKMPLPGVFIDFADAPEVMSGPDGGFLLNFVGVKQGDFLKTNSIIKKGWELVNFRDFQHLQLGRSPSLGVDIIMAPKGTIYKSRQLYYNIADKAILQGFQEELNILTERLNILELEEVAYNEKVDSLTQVFLTEESHLMEIAERFARTNLDDVDSVFLEAVQLFAKGEFRKAKEAIQSTDLERRLIELQREKESVRTLYTELYVRDSISQIYTKKMITEVRLMADIYQVNFQSDSSKLAYDRLLLLDSNDYEILIAASQFYQENFWNEDAARVYQLIIAHPKHQKWDLANSHLHRGKYINRQINLDSALNEINTAIEIYTSLSTERPDFGFFGDGLGSCFNYLGDIYSDFRELEKAKDMYQKSISIYQDLLSEYPQKEVVKVKLAGSYYALGITFSRLGNNLSAIKSFERQRDLALELLNYDPDKPKYNSQLASAYLGLGNVHSTTGNFKLGMEFFKYRHEIISELNYRFQESMDFSLSLAVSFMNMAEISAAADNYSDAKNYYENGIHRMKLLIRKFPKNLDFQLKLVNSLERTAKLYSLTDDSLISFNYLASSKTIIDSLLFRLPSNILVNESALRIFISLGEYHQRLNQPNLAIKNFLEANSRAIFLLETITNSPIHQHYLALTYFRLGECENEIMNQRNNSSKEKFSKAFSIWTELTEKAPDNYTFRKYLEKTKDYMSKY